MSYIAHYVITDGWYNETGRLCQSDMNSFFSLPSIQFCLMILGRLSCWQLWDVTPTASTSCWRKKQRLMLQTNRALPHCTELWVYSFFLCAKQLLDSKIVSPHTAACVLSLQAMLGSEDCVSALLEHGASALCRDSQGRTPLHLATSCGHTKLLNTLLKTAKKADPLDSMLDFRGYTPTHWAAYHGEKNPFFIFH